MLICNFFLITLKKSLKNLKDHTFINNYWTWKNDIEYTYEELYLDKNRRFFRSNGVTINIKLLTRNTFTRNPI